MQTATHRQRHLPRSNMDQVTRVKNSKSGQAAINLKLRRFSPLVVFLTLSLASASARADDEDAQIVVGCHFSIGEFGTAAIQICIRQNRAARETVEQYPQEVQASVTRCTRRLEPDWLRIRKCVEDDIAAAAALEDYVRNHGPTVERCRESFGAHGDHRVRICVEQAIQAQKPNEGQ
jgi:hypothetical protein